MADVFACVVLALLCAFICVCGISLLVLTEIIPPEVVRGWLVRKKKKGGK